MSIIAVPLTDIAPPVETIELTSSSVMVPNSSRPIGPSVRIADATHSLRSTTMFSSPDVPQDVLNALAARPDLLALDLSTCFMNERMAARFVPALGRCAPQLQQLDLSNAHLTTDSVVLVAALLGVLPALHTLDLRGNNACDEGKPLELPLCHLIS